MIQPEHPWAADIDLPALPTISIPAAGHLGVIEEQCSWIHMSFALPVEEGPFVCKNCGGSV